MRNNLFNSEHGGDIYTEGILKGNTLIDFSSNINPLGIPTNFVKYMDEAVEKISVYPDILYRNLKENIAEYLVLFLKLFMQTEEGLLNKCLTINNIILGNGAAEIIDLVLSKFKKVVIVIPSFCEYEKSSKKWGCSISYVVLNEDMEYDYAAILSALVDAEALIIANPNNPNGGIIDKSKFSAIIDFCEKHNKIIIIDEAFVEFAGKGNISFLKEAFEYKSIFIIKALTKFYGMPGIRLGYGISSNLELVEYIESQQIPWNINCFAEVAAKYALKDKEYIERSIEFIKLEKEFLSYELEQINFIDKVFNSHGNYILCHLKYIDSEELYNNLINYKILIRRCNNFKGLNNFYIRLAVKDRDNNKMLITALREIQDINLYKE